MKVNNTKRFYRKLKRNNLGNSSCLKKYVKNEKGNTLLVILGLLIGSIFISFIFFDFFTTFASKRVSQTSADAAALAAANEIKEIYDDKLKTEIVTRMDLLRDAANELVDERLPEELDEEGNTISPTQAQVNAAWESVLSQMQIPPELRQAVRYVNAEINANVALKYFFHNPWYKNWFNHQIEEINVIVCNEIRNTKSQWTEAAKYYSDINGANEDVEIQFIGDEFRVMARVKKETSFITVSDQSFNNGERDIYAEAEASIKTPKDIVISCN